jgi:type IV pilus assembly protein PilW
MRQKNQVTIMMMKNNKYAYGFTLVEIMVAMVIGVIVLGGALSMQSGTRNTQQMNEARMDMVADARFAISMISHDLRHAGMWGGTVKDSLIECKSTDATCTLTPAAVLPPVVAVNDCASAGNPLWAYDIVRPVFAIDGSTGNPYSDTCIVDSEGYLATTDILEIKYADSNPATALLTEQAYIRSNFKGGQIFIGDTQPVIPNRDDAADTLNHVLHAYAYYVSKHTDVPNDGIPSLRRVSLVRGPELQNQMLISGVADLQVQFGEDTTANGIVNRYVDANNVGDWSAIHAVKIWLLMRSDEKPSTSGIVPDKTFDIATVAVTKTDGYQYFMVTSIVNLRNIRQQ